MERRPQTLEFPLGGLDRSLSYQTQPPYSTTDALNVLPQDGALERARGGLRPATVKYSSNGWGSRFRCLNTFSSIDGVRSLIGATVSGGVSYASISGGAASNGANLNTTGRVQCVQYGKRVYFVGDDVQSMPVYAEYSDLGAVSGIGAMTLESGKEPLVAFPASYPRCIAVKYNRLWLSWNGGTTSSAGFASRYWASKVGNERNFEDDAGLANTDAFSAELNTDRQLITAMIPWYDNYMVFTTATTTYVLTGDPRKGGIMRQISGRIGIVDCASWTIGEDNTIYAMSNSGPIMLTPQNPFGEPTLLMKDKLPGVLTVPEGDTDYTFAYDSRARRLYVFCPHRTATANVDHWVLDLRTKSFWPIRFASTDHEPFACVQIKEISSERSDLLMGCRDGYLRYWNETQAQDDGSNISSYVMLGPYRIDEEHDCRIAELIGTLSTSSGRVVVSLHVGNSAQAAASAASSWSNAWTAGRNKKDRPRIRGGVFYVKISGTANARWEFEHALANLSLGGKLRL